MAKPVSKQEVDSIDEEKEEKDSVSQAISGIELVRKRMQESHNLITNAAGISLEEQKMAGKVKRLVKHMDQALHWLS